MKTVIIPFIAAGVLFGSPAAVWAQNRTDGGPDMEDALRRGDRSQVARILDERKSNKVLRDLAQALLDGDETRVADLSERCVNGAFAAKAVPLAIQCNRHLASTYFERGQTAEWAARMQWLRDTGLPALQGRETARMGGPFGELDYKRFAALAKQRETKTAERQSIPVERFPSADSELWNPTIAITVNGTRLLALLDTGTTASLGISPEAARRAKVETLAEGLPIVASGTAPPGSARPLDALAVASDVRIGPLKIEHMGVTVTPALPKGVSAIVGLSLLQRFESALLTDRQIELSFSRDTACRDGVPLTYSSAGKGIGKLLLPMVLNGRPQPAVLDTGLQGMFAAMDPLATELGAGRLPKKEYPIRIAEGWVKRTGAETQLTATLAGKRLVDPTARLFPSARAEPALYTGASLLDSNDLLLDFSGAKACLLDKPKSG